MARDELIEWIVMMLCILLWWPVLFVSPSSALYPLVTSVWYHALTRYGVPLALVVIFVRRYKRMKAGLAYSEQVVQSQRFGMPTPPLDDNPPGKPKR